MCTPLFCHCLTYWSIQWMPDNRNTVRKHRKVRELKGNWIATWLTTSFPHKGNSTSDLRRFLIATVKEQRGGDKIRYAQQLESWACPGHRLEVVWAMQSLWQKSREIVTVDTQMDEHDSIPQRVLRINNRSLNFMWISAKEFSYFFFFFSS